MYYLHVMMNPDETFLDGRYYAAVFIAFSYTCTNPFIYATKFDPVRKILREMISCRKTPDQPTTDPVGDRINMDIMQ